MTMESGDYISLPVISQFITSASMPTAASTTAPDTQISAPAQTAETDAEYNQALSSFETSYLINLLQSTGGNVEEAARLAGMNMATIYRKLKKHNINKEDYS